MILDLLKSKKVAVLDGVNPYAIDLYLEHDNGDFETLYWPEDWPCYVDVDFLEKQGFEVKMA